MRINLITLGCSKNLVDSEKLLYQLSINGHQVFHNSENYEDVVIINTCGFILDAKTESIETILSFIEAKKQGFIAKVVVMGCLSKRYRESLIEEMPEVDAFFGVEDIDKIVKYFQGNYYPDQLHKRFDHTPGHYAYLKISEGCNRNCAFCAIPGIRGKQVSLPIEKLVQEARELAASGAKELILIAQELTSYGTDIYRKKALPELIEELVKIDEFHWIRLHYAYPDGFPAEEIVELMKKHSKICRYLDIPVQHASNSMLGAMNRGHTKQDIEEIITVFRSGIPDISIRSTLISGFPGETASDHQELLAFVREIKFDRLGVFTYSHEEGTKAYKMDDSVPEELKMERKEEIQNLQEKISLEKNMQKTGKILEVLIDYREGEFYIGRTEFDSPEIDNQVLIPVSDKKLKIGSFYQVEIFDALEFDLYGKVIE